MCFNPIIDLNLEFHGLVCSTFFIFDIDGDLHFYDYSRRILDDNTTVSRPT